MVPATLLRPFCQLPGCALDGIRAWTAAAPSLPWNSRFFTTNIRQFSVFDDDGGGDDRRSPSGRSPCDTRRDRRNVDDNSQIRYLIIDHFRNFESTRNIEARKVFPSSSRVFILALKDIHVYSPRSSLSRSRRENGSKRSTDPARSYHSETGYSPSLPPPPPPPQHDGTRDSGGGSGASSVAKAGSQ